MIQMFDLHVGSDWDYDTKDDLLVGSDWDYDTKYDLLVGSDWDSVVFQEWPPQNTETYTIIYTQH